MSAPSSMLDIII